MNPNPVEEATAYLQEAAQHHYFTASGAINVSSRHATTSPSPYPAPVLVPWSSDPVGLSIADADADIYPSLFVDTSVGHGLVGGGLDSAGSYGSYGYPDSGFSGSLLSASDIDASSGSDERGVNLGYYLPHVSCLSAPTCGWMRWLTRGVAGRSGRLRRPDGCRTTARRRSASTSPSSWASRSPAGAAASSRRIRQRRSCLSCQWCRASRWSRWSRI